MKRKLTVILALTVVLTLAFAMCACTGKPSKPEKPVKPDSGTSPKPDPVKPEGTAGTYSKITADEANKRIGSGDKIMIIDVRDTETYNKKHVEGAMPMSMADLESSAATKLPDKKMEVLVYGKGSVEFAKKLIAMGYTNVKDFGEFEDWTFKTATGAYVAP
ncbi:MAG: rhodanese-like domain-containing protein [Oscillospiraceae bacterium]